MLIPAYAKVNFFLEIKGRMENGYHDLRMIMQRISLHDDIYIKENKLGIIRTGLINERDFTDSRLKMLSGSDNIVYKVSDILLNKYLPGVGADIRIHKRIPMEAGLGGGSADAASALLGLNWYFDLGLTLDELSAIGLPFGADIPFCLKGGLAVVEGIGEKIVSLPKTKSLYFVIVKPDVGISTKEAYAYYDENADKTALKKDFDGLRKALEKGELSQISANMFNDLETVAFRMSADIVELRKELYNMAGNSLMTGSGSAVFALFDDQNRAKECLERIKRFENRAQVFFANSL